MQDTKTPGLTVWPGATLPTEVIDGVVADDDFAIKVFLESYARRSPHTRRSYEKECRRFLLWVRARHASKADNSHSLLPLVAVADINAYIEFLGNPLPFSEPFLKASGWDHQPFRTALSAESVRHSITVLHKMFEALRNLRSRHDQPYCLFNPTVLAQSTVSTPGPTEEEEQAFTNQEWEVVQSVIEDLPRKTDRDVAHYHRCRWLTQLLYRTFLRREEASKLRMGSFEQTPEGWNIRFVGKGDKKAKIIATEKLMDELAIYRIHNGLPRFPSSGETRPAVLAISNVNRGISAQAIYLICKVIFNLAADRLENTNPLSASRLRKASPHWMRHTGVSHGMESDVDPRHIQAQARHSSLNVTARYDHKQRQAWREDLAKMT